MVYDWTKLAGTLLVKIIILNNFDNTTDNIARLLLQMFHWYPVKASCFATFHISNNIPNQFRIKMKWLSEWLSAVGSPDLLLFLFEPRSANFRIIRTSFRKMRDKMLGNKFGIPYSIDSTYHLFLASNFELQHFCNDGPCFFMSASCTSFV